jgi:hypothetical protein
MIESPAWRSQSLSGHRLRDRIEIELCKHGGKDNGRLPVTHQDFIDYGIDHDAIAPAIREQEALGFIGVIPGFAGKAGQRRPNLFRLTYVKSFGEEPTNEWAAILTIEDAKHIAKAARSRVARKQTGFGRENENPRSGKTGFSAPGNPERKVVFLAPGNPERGPQIPAPGNPEYYLDNLPKSRNGAEKGASESEASPPLAFSTVSSH